MPLIRFEVVDDRVKITLEDLDATEASELAESMFEIISEAIDEDND